MVGTTNHLDQLDPGLSSRPSRFDRKYLFPLPSTEERVLYCEYWRDKLASKPSIKFPKKLCPAIAGITQDFSFAYLKEAFVATLLVIAGNRSEDSIRGGGGDEGGDLDDYELWREIVKQIKLLRDDMDSRTTQYSAYDWNSGYHQPHTWKALDQNQETGAASAAEVSSHKFQDQLPIRGTKGEYGTRKEQPNPRLAGQTVDRDANHAPLMTDSGMFIESRFGGVGGLELL